MGVCSHSKRNAFAKFCKHQWINIVIKADIETISYESRFLFRQSPLGDELEDIKTIEGDVYAY